RNMLNPGVWRLEAVRLGEDGLGQLDRKRSRGRRRSRTDLAWRRSLGVARHTTPDRRYRRPPMWASQCPGRCGTDYFLAVRIWSSPDRSGADAPSSEEMRSSR